MTPSFAALEGRREAEELMTVSFGRTSLAGGDGAEGDGAVAAPWSPTIEPPKATIADLRRRSTTVRPHSAAPLTRAVSSGEGDDQSIAVTSVFALHGLASVLVFVCLLVSRPPSVCLWAAIVNPLPLGPILTQVDKGAFRVFLMQLELRGRRESQAPPPPPPLTSMTSNGDFPSFCTFAFAPTRVPVGASMLLHNDRFSNIRR